RPCSIAALMTSPPALAGSITSASRPSSIPTFVPLSFGGTRPSGIPLDRAYPVKSVCARGPDREHQSGRPQPPRPAPPSPPPADAWLTALARHGRLSLAEILAPSIELCDGFPVYPRLAAAIERLADRLREWPTSAAVFLPNGRPPRVGEILVQRELGALFRRLSAIERSHESEGRANAIMAARDAIYQGDIAEQIAGFFGDPEQVDVPIEGLLEKSYAAIRRGLIDDARAHPGLPEPGDPWRFEGRAGPRGYRPRVAEGVGAPDTSFACAMDAEGNAFAATPSDPGLGAPLVRGLGMIVSTRGAQLWTTPGHPS